LICVVGFSRREFEKPRLCKVRLRRLRGLGGGMAFAVQSLQAERVTEDGAAMSTGPSRKEWEW
jgi:hypothetical protein